MANYFTCFLECVFIVLYVLCDVAMFDWYFWLSYSLSLQMEQVSACTHLASVISMGNSPVGSTSLANTSLLISITLTYSNIPWNQEGRDKGEEHVITFRQWVVDTHYEAAVCLNLSLVSVPDPLPSQGAAIKANLSSIHSQGTTAH